MGNLVLTLAWNKHEWIS